MSRLAGKIAFITGAGGGIGRAMCERFAVEGALVAAADINLQLAQATVDAVGAGGRDIALQCDVGEADSVRAAIARTVAAFGGLNVLWFARTWVSRSPWAAGRTGR